MHTDQTVIIINTLVETIWLTSCFCFIWTEKHSHSERVTVMLTALRYFFSHTQITSYSSIFRINSPNNDGPADAEESCDK